MAGEESGEIGTHLLVQGGERHKERTRQISNEVLATRLEQTIDWFAMGNNISKEEALTKARNELDKISKRIS